jgi:guanosine-3',5'-bis(diphosphate) 3'-pyrophosphohydrolase
MSQVDAIVIRAIDFAAQRHSGQIRKGKQQSPYINHPIRVMKLLVMHQETEADLLMAAVLHDVIEDTAKTDREIQELSGIIRKNFGQGVLDIVREVSDDKTLPFQERKRLQVINTPGLSEEARKIKIADKTCNILDMMEDPPENWPNERKLQYVEWAGLVIDGARGVNPGLEKEFDATRQQALRRFA